MLGVQGVFEKVQRKTYTPEAVAVKVEDGEAASEKVPVPPLTIDQAPVPIAGVFPPKAVEVKPQIVCAVPTVAVVGGCTIVTN